MQNTKASKETGQTGSTPAELLQLVSFKIGDEEFAVDILKVQEINRMFEVTRVPTDPSISRASLISEAKSFRSSTSVQGSEWREKIKTRTHGL